MSQSLDPMRWNDYIARCKRWHLGERLGFNCPASEILGDPSLQEGWDICQDGLVMLWLYLQQQGRDSGVDGWTWGVLVRPAIIRLARQRGLGEIDFGLTVAALLDWMKRELQRAYSESPVHRKDISESCAALKARDWREGAPGQWIDDWGLAASLMRYHNGARGMGFAGSTRAQQTYRAGRLAQRVGISFADYMRDMSPEFPRP